MSAKAQPFHVTVPLELTGNIEPADIQEAKPAGVSRLPHNVIVIDDDPLQRDIVSEMLERNASLVPYVPQPRMW